jgi:hypothetical protein
MGGGDLVSAPTYVLITVSLVADTDAFKNTIQDLVTATAPFSGRLAVSLDKPVSWEGTTPEHIVMIQFEIKRRPGKTLRKTLTHSRASTLNFTAARPQLCNLYKVQPHR